MGRVEGWIWSGGFHSPNDILGSFTSEDAVPAGVVKTGPVINLKAWLSVLELVKSSLSVSVDILLETERGSDDDGGAQSGSKMTLGLSTRGSTRLFADSRDQFSGSFGSFDSGTWRKIDPNFCA